MVELFAPVVGGRISMQIIEQIRKGIRSGRLRPGDRLPAERELAERFGVSRVTVRDALRSLEVLGLVQIRVGASGGAFVTSPGTEVVGEGLTNLMLLSELEPEEIAEARLVLELGSVALATVRAGEDDLERLRRMVADARHALAAGSYQGAMSLQFHLLIAAIARNKAISLITDSFRGPLSMHAIRQHETVSTSYQQTVEEHEAITAAIERRDAAAAQRVMAQHLLRGTNASADVVHLLVGSPALDRKVSP